MMEESIIDQMEAIIKKGQRTIMLWEMFIEQIGATKSDGIKEILAKFKQSQEDHSEALLKFGMMIPKGKSDENDTQNEGVSVSNY